jgi:hypothetical protein
MSSTDVIKDPPGLTEAQRARALELQARIQALQIELKALVGEPTPEKSVLELRDRGIDETQAADLRARLKTFAEDWERPEAAIYDEQPAR